MNVVHISYNYRSQSPQKKRVFLVRFFGGYFPSLRQVPNGFKTLSTLTFITRYFHCLCAILPSSGREEGEENTAVN